MSEKKLEKKNKFILKEEDLAKLFLYGYYYTDIDDFTKNEIYDCFLYNIDRDVNTNIISYMLENAIRKCIGSRVKPPIVMLLSGGIDSTYILLNLLECFSASDITTVTIKYSEKEYDESNSAELISKLLGIEHETCLLDHTDIGDLFDHIADYGLKSVFFSSSIIPTFNAIFHSTIFNSNNIVTGDGGDELFYGYDRYLIYKYLNNFRKILYPTSLLSYKNRRLNKMKQFIKEGYLSTTRIFTVEEVSGLLKSKVVDNSLTPDYYSDLNPINRVMYFDIVNELFGVETKKVDNAAFLAFNSTLKDDSIISPFLDLDVLKLCCKIESNLKYKYGTRKWLLRKFIETKLPDYDKIVGSNKRGFAVPINKWLLNYAHDISGVIYNLAAQKVLDYKTAKNLLLDFKKGNDVAEKVWAIYFLGRLIEMGVIAIERDYKKVIYTS